MSQGDEEGGGELLGKVNDQGMCKARFVGEDDDVDVDVDGDVGDGRAQQYLTGTVTVVSEAGEYVPVFVSTCLVTSKAPPGSSASTLPSTYPSTSSSSHTYTNTKKRIG